MSGRRTGWLLGSAALACIVVLWWHDRGANALMAAAGEPSPAAAISADPPRATTDIVSPAALRDDPQYDMRMGPLRGTKPDGGVDLGFGGHLKPDLALRRLFDYYLAMLGKTSMDGIHELLQDDLQRRQLDQPVIVEVMQAFDRYVSYQQAVVALANQPGLTLAENFRQMGALQRQILGDVLTDAFYAGEEQQQQQLLQRLAIQSDPNLSAAEKARRLQALNAALPAAEQDAQAEATVGNTVQQQTALLDSEQADPATRYAERAKVWGDQAADRLAQLDTQRVQWQARLDTYAQQSQAIRADSTLDAAQQQTSLQSLLQQSFQGPERVQVQAMAQAGLLNQTAH